MIIKGDSIKLVKPMGVFTNIGEICEVTAVNEDGSICFRFGGCHLGCMSYNEYEKYFEKVEKPVVLNKKYPWTEWESCNDFIKGVSVGYKYKTNGVKVIVRHLGLKSKSSCCPTDNFDLITGIELAMARVDKKLAEKRIDELTGKYKVDKDGIPKEKASKYKEVGRKAKIGEYVKVINAGKIPITNDKPDYKDGDILKIIDEWFASVRYAKGTADNGKERVLNSCEYVVLLGYVPDENCQKLVK